MIQYSSVNNSQNILSHNALNDERIKLIMKIKKNIIWIINYVNLYIKHWIYGNKYFVLIGSPLHGNLGDQALVLGELNFFHEKKKGYKLIDIPSEIFQQNTKKFTKIIKDRIILIHAGGFLGDTWINEERMVRTVIQSFPNNKIIILPQTIYFSNTSDGIQEQTLSEQIYNEHNNLVICTREETSFNLAKTMFPNQKALLIPDMALYLKPCIREKSENIALLCLRVDIEGILSDFEKENVEESLKKYDFADIKYTDTVIKRKIYQFMRKYEVTKKLKEFAQAKLVVTDRLHGMIFALLTGTPCIVLPNHNYKVSGVYQWIKKSNIIKFISDIQDIDDSIKQILEQKDDGHIINDLKSFYEPLLKEIENI